VNAAFASSRNEIRKIATAFLAGESLPLESALTVRALITDDCPLEEARQIVTCVVSETDDILLDDRRQLWHADVRDAESDKHDRAQEWARPLIQQACEQLLAALREG